MGTRWAGPSLPLYAPLASILLLYSVWKPSASLPVPQALYRNSAIALFLTEQSTCYCRWGRTLSYCFLGTGSALNRGIRSFKSSWFSGAFNPGHISFKFVFPFL